MLRHKDPRVYGETTVCVTVSLNNWKAAYRLVSVLERLGYLLERPPLADLGLIAEIAA